MISVQLKMRVIIKFISWTASVIEKRWRFGLVSESMMKIYDYIGRLRWELKRFVEPLRWLLLFFC